MNSIYSYLIQDYNVNEKIFVIELFNFIIIYNTIAANSWGECHIKILKVFDKKH